MCHPPLSDNWDFGPPRHGHGPPCHGPRRPAGAAASRTGMCEDESAVSRPRKGRGQGRKEPRPPERCRARFRRHRDGAPWAGRRGRSSHPAAAVKARHQRCDRDGHAHVLTCDHRATGHDGDDFGPVRPRADDGCPGTARNHGTGQDAHGPYGGQDAARLLDRGKGLALGAVGDQRHFAERAAPRRSARSVAPAGRISRGQVPARRHPAR